MNRRSALRAGLMGAGVLAVGCTHHDPAPSPPAPDFTALETQLSGRLGVFALDTGSGATVGHRADERFLMCSTAKTLAVAAVLRQNERRPGLVDQVVRYGQADVLEWAPVTAKHVDTGMTVGALCDAAITVSDNTAANLLVGLLGGPPAVTEFARSLGDSITSVDRLEPDLNVTSPGDRRDTSTPAQMAQNLRGLSLGDGQHADARDRLVALLKANTTGGQCIRAGLPQNWVVGDKTGSGAQGESNDIAIVWPPGRPPLAIAVYTDPTTRIWLRSRRTA
ncbi:class A beta-lactamase [Candidatus Mycobacterium wuenschmannii]|uniref:Beta-lactamase n=1 Tax=Candidatus Mycobacterium wuenschmannii TaxID=3027808 RepID=A0ABY8W082_9MYCO|nr:class A beta-lactamase [Candidatus Mycobacterium wuenschmannii]WIM87174.1 class A beta-lactamase [Candidatus Mycobacterium wuenschmannii]